ncbi:MAG: hypothetical protein OHK0017_12500 [Patescibacteria group bacterium]
MTPEWYFYLKVSALIFFNLFFIFAFILTLVSLGAVVKITKQVNKLLESLQLMAEEATSYGEDIMDFVMEFIRPKRSIWYYLSKVFRK